MSSLTPPSTTSCSVFSVNACLGVSGCVFRDINQLAGHVVAGVLCICLVLSYIAQASA